MWSEMTGGRWGYIKGISSQCQPGQNSSYHEKSTYEVSLLGTTELMKTPKL